MRARWRIALLAAWGLGGLAFLGADGPPRDELYFYDEPDRAVEADSVAGAAAYDACLAARDGELWMAWLEYAPGEGDRILVGRRAGDGWALRERVTKEAARYANPSLTFDAAGALWLTYEAERGPDGPWDVLARRWLGEQRYTEALRVSEGAGNDLHHRAAADPEGGLWVAWQSERDGDFDVVVRRIGADRAAWSEELVVSDRPRGDWHPALAVTPAGAVCVAWDSYTGESFDVLARWLVDGDWSPVRSLAGGPGFEGRAQVAADSSGRVWVLWEEGAEGWGAPFRGLKKLWNNVTDAGGPLHRWRRLRLALHAPDGTLRFPAEPPPTPSFDLAARRERAREGVARLGAFYERGALVVDGRDRPWVLHRHYYEPQLGLDEATTHHVERGWRIQARCLGADGWGELVGCDEPQRDGMQRLSAAALGDRVAAAWTTGRTDRRKDPRPRGVALAEWAVGEGRAPRLSAGGVAPGTASVEPGRGPRPTESLGGREYRLFLGDLHRHTDLSLCFPYYDGSIDDAYRYAIDVARLDFLGITDHTRDIAKGDVASLLWWRCTKEVRRHRLGEAFFPYFAYERSHGDTDHNVISLRDDVLRNFPPPLPEFWAQIDGDTFTIPHNPFIGRVWEHHDDERRPLLEIYQGCRDEDCARAAHEGLARGYHMGFVASSDHMSTSASYAGVWAPAADRETIFRALQARRTYGATDRLRLVVRCGEHWMGERLALEGEGRLHFSVEGTGALERVDLIRDGALLRTWEGAGRESLAGSHPVLAPPEGESYLYVHVRQVDGNQAWSSPIWIRTPQDG